MSDEEKEAIEKTEKWLNKEESYCTDEDIKTVLNLIEKQSKEIEHQKEKRENQKKELAILNAKQIEFNKLVNTVNSYKGQFKRQQKEIEESKQKEKEAYNFGYRNGCNDTSKFNDKTFIRIDKIKAKIEDKESQINDIRDNLDYDEVMVNEVKRLENEIEVLQSLLEKE